MQIKLKMETKTKKEIDAKYRLLLKRMRYIYRTNFDSRKENWKEYCDANGIYYLAKKIKDLDLSDETLLKILNHEIFI